SLTELPELKFTDPVSGLKGVGPGRNRLLLNLGVEKIEDLMYHLPKRYEDRRFLMPISRLEPGIPVVVRGTIGNFRERPARKENLRIATFTAFDASGEIKVVLFGGPRSFFKITEGRSVFLYGSASVAADNSLELLNPEYAVRSTDEGAPPWFRLWPVYPTTKGLSLSWLAALIHSCVTSPDLAIDETLPPRIIEKYSFPAIKEAFKGIHAPDNPEEAECARCRLAYQELYENQRRFAESERERTTVRAKPMTSGADLEKRFAESLPFNLTESQKQATLDIAADMDGSNPMHRLLIGDVASGKTAVAVSAAARCAGAGYQAAILVPTTILADQFFAFCERYLAGTGAKVAKISGGMRQPERDELLWKLRDGEIDVIVGTHAMLGDRVAFRSLGLLVIDEQQRFGVRQRDRLISVNRGVHVLMTSATPIPRTLRMALYGDIAYTQIASRPDKPRILTKLVSDNHLSELYKYIEEKVVGSGERCYWVCPRIGDAGDDDSSVNCRALDIKKNLQRVRVEVLTGVMRADEKARAMERFAGSPGIMVSTTVIEVGVDVRGANIMVIESASSYGLSQLHQIRGRVGRGTRSGICILLDNAKNLSGNKRLELLIECGDGFRIAEEDLRMRGAGEYLGVRQHGEESFRVADMPRDEKWFLAARDDTASTEPI
ncbi:MAG: ATP-dependent DNA helicase RecG, partial [Synergistaceae bacterium]|nr:ATP-dependent DNA helicase RecG [Synergistaceae bacterium]